jgi:hypothetical protein
MTTHAQFSPRRLLNFWSRRRDSLMSLAIVMMSIASSVWLGYQFRRLLFDDGVMGAIDLRQRYDEVHAWFAGEKVYGAIAVATYPPASLILLWPFLGWLDFPWARWLWAATAVLCLYWLVRIFLRHSRTRNPFDRAFIALLPLSIYATGATIGNGQLMVHLMPCLISAIVLTATGQGRWLDDVLVAFLFMLALVKPSVTAPFFWLILFAAKSIRPAVIVLLGYGCLTLWSGAYQDNDTGGLMREWVRNSAKVIQGEATQYSNGNLHSVLFRLDEIGWLPYLSASLLAGLGIWVRVYRRSEIWLLMGVAALVSRFYTYHGWYDDVLVLLPMVALFRLLQLGPLTPLGRTFGAGLFVATLAIMVAPGGLYLLPAPWNEVFVLVQTCILFTLLLFLLHATWRPGHISEPR